MNGLLLSQIWWSNHTSVIAYYEREFLRDNVQGYRHLEIGPGHGLLLFFAAADPRCSLASGWDLSEASLDATSQALDKLGVPRQATLVRQSIFDPTPTDERFDSVVISEVCEHLEDPRAALASLGRVLAPEGRLFVNMPINSPAPDHLYLLRTPEEVVELVRSAGYTIEATRFFPLSGYGEARARKAGLTISCVVVARPA
jgi:2-polyprenyl-3-methyl-5-hydroxy-6-metoxy-1,4-benzoquinol methylase